MHKPAPPPGSGNPREPLRDNRGRREKGGGDRLEPIYQRPKAPPPPPKRSGGGGKP